MAKVVLAHLEREAARIYAKLQKATVPLAVFVRYGETKVTKTTSEFCDTLMDKSFRYLMGVYDINATLHNIEEDLAYMLSRYNPDIILPAQAKLYEPHTAQP